MRRRLPSLRLPIAVTFGSGTYNSSDLRMRWVVASIRVMPGVVVQTESATQ